MKSLNNNTVYFFSKKTCPQCSPMRALVEQSLVGSTVLQFKEVVAEAPNLELCCDLKVTKTPAIVIRVNKETSSPMYEPVEIAEKIKHAKNIARRTEEAEEEDS